MVQMEVIGMQSLRKKRDAKLEALKRRIEAGAFPFLIVIDDTTKCAVLDLASWKYMKRDIIEAIEKSNEWHLTELP